MTHVCTHNRSKFVTAICMSCGGEFQKCPRCKGKLVLCRTCLVGGVLRLLFSRDDPGGDA
jgi:hypothetical protein